MDEISTVGVAETNLIGAPSNGGVFFLEQILGHDVDKTTIINQTIEQYPPNLLTSDSNLYILVDLGQLHPYKSGILTFRTRQFLRSQSLDGFVHRIEAAGRGVVVSFGQEDFDRFLAVVGQRELWGVPEQSYQHRQYKVHKYGNPPGRRNDIVKGTII